MEDYIGVNRTYCESIEDYYYKINYSLRIIIELWIRFIKPEINENSNEKEKNILMLVADIVKQLLLVYDKDIQNINKCLVFNSSHVLSRLVSSTSEEGEENRLDLLIEKLNSFVETIEK